MTGIAARPAGWPAYRAIAATIGILCIGAALSVRAATDPFGIGERVEVREGDTWSSATVIGREGGKVQVHYDGSTTADDEWVTPDRLRAPGAGQPAKPVEAPALRFSIKDHVEVKWGGMYRKATVVNTRRGWYLVTYDPAGAARDREWVESNRVRAVGSTDDPIGYASPHHYTLGDGPPPGPSILLAKDAAKATDGPSKISADAGPGGLTIVDPDRTGVRDVEPTTPPPGTPLVPPPPSDLPVAPAPHNLSLGHGQMKFGSSRVVTNPQGKYALLVYTPFGGDHPAVNIQRCDLASGSASRVQPLAPDVYPLAISPNGSRVLSRSDKFGGDTKWRLDLWNVSADTPKPLLSFRPFEPGGKRADDAIRWARFLDATHVLVASDDNQVSLFNVTDTAAKAVYTIDGDPGVAPRMTGGGRYFVAGFDGKLVVCEAMTGRCIAGGTPPRLVGLPIGLRPDLRRLAITGDHRLIVTDLGDGAALLDVNLPLGVAGNTSVDWLDDHLLLIDRRWVYDVDHHALAWEFPSEDAADAGFVGDRLWYLSTTGNLSTDGPGRMMLTSTPVPGDAGAKADKHLPDAPVLVSPGEKVSLQVDVSASAEERQRIVEHLTQELSDNGVTVVDGAPVSLVASIKNGDSVTEQYRHLSGPGAGQTESVTVTKTLYSLSFEAGGKSVWAATSVRGFAPAFVRLQPGQSIASAVADLNKQDPGWFLHVPFPKMLVGSTEPLGTTPLGTTPLGPSSQLRRRLARPQR